MSQKTTTTSTNQYNQAGMGNYTNFQGTLGSGLQNYAQNPLASSFFNQQLSMAQNNASAIGQRNISNVASNLRTGGGLLGNSGSFMQSQINRAAGQNSVNQTGAFNNTLNSALQNRQWALQSMQGYTPLQTGATQVQQQSPNWAGIAGGLVGAGLNFAAPGFGSMLGGGSFGGGYAANPYSH